MSTNNTYLAVFLGSKTSARRAAWDALPEGERSVKEKKAYPPGKLGSRNITPRLSAMGGPLGKTKKVSQRGIDDTSNKWAPLR